MESQDGNLKDQFSAIPFPGIDEPDERIAAYTSHLFGPHVNSSDRAAELIRLLDSDWNVSADVAWPVFHETWTNCDNTWPHRDDLSSLIDRLRELGDPLDHLNEEDAAAFKRLPEHIRIYRGCSVERTYGFAWATDRNVAEQFARGHRGISVPEPVIADLTQVRQLLEKNG